MNFLNNIEPIKGFFDKGLLQNVLVSIIAFVFGYIVSWYRRNSYVIIYNLRKMTAFLQRRQYVFFWNDHSIDTSENIIAFLKEHNPKIKFKALSEPEDLLKFPLSPKKINTIFLIVSDVTKLAETELKRKQIQQRIISYVRKGGTFFGTHDIIYRRCRNEVFQNAFGCEIVNFQRFSEPIDVNITSKYSQHPLIKDLDKTFTFDDGELCWGDWTKDAKILLKTVKQYEANDGSSILNIPILTIRHTGDFGILIWLNSADKSDKLARSLSEPQKEVIKIFDNAIKYKNEMKEYYKSAL